MAVIPVNNSPALVGYYLGVASLIPLLGFATGPVALVCGILGARKAKIQPQAAGMGHAVAAILMGVGGPLFWILLTVLVLS